MLERDREYLNDKLEYPAEAKGTDYKSAVKFDEQFGSLREGKPLLDNPFPFPGRIKVEDPRFFELFEG